MALPYPFVMVDETDTGQEGVPWNHTGPRTYIRIFLVQVEDKRATPNLVAEAPGLPIPYSPFTNKAGTYGDALSLCIAKRARHRDTDDWQFWTVTCEYSTDLGAGGPAAFPGQAGGQSGAQNNPEMEPPEIGFDFEVFHKAMFKDLDGKAILNSATQPFTPAQTDERGVAVLNYARNEMEFNWKKACTYCYAVNAKPFMGAPKGCVLCMPPKAKVVFKGKISFWRVAYQFKFGYMKDSGDLEDWQPEILDAGLCHLAKIPKRFIKVLGAIMPLNPMQEMEPVPIIKRGLPISQPVLLDGKGQEAKAKWIARPIPPNFQGVGVQDWDQLMEPGEQVVGNALVKIQPTPVYLKFRTKRTADFGKLLVRGFT